MYLLLFTYYIFLPVYKDLAQKAHTMDTMGADLSKETLNRKGIKVRTMSTKQADALARARNSQVRLQDKRSPQEILKEIEDIETALKSRRGETVTRRGSNNSSTKDVRFNTHSTTGFGVNGSAVSLVDPMDANKAKRTAGEEADRKEKRRAARDKHRRSAKKKALMRALAADPEKAAYIRKERDNATQVKSWVKSVQPRDANAGVNKVEAYKAASLSNISAEPAVAKK